jgi:predicted enzyme related to lactoylglutathione lyase
MKETPMTAGIKILIVPVADLAKAKATFRQLLGVEPYADQPNYVGFKVAGQDIGLDPNGHRSGMTGPVAYLHVADIQRSLQVLLDAGGEVQGKLRDVGGRQIVTVKDADGNAIGLLQGS